MELLNSILEITGGTLLAIICVAFIAGLLTGMFYGIRKASQTLREKEE